MAPSLRAERVSCVFGETAAVSDLSFRVPEGAFLTLLGPSGCGKTTTLRCLAGLERPTSGSIWFGERQVVGGRTYVNAKDRGVGMVFQSYAIWPHMRVRDNIAYGLRGRRRPSPEITHRVDDIATLTGIEHLLNRYPAQLSGGQQQRVALARALVYQPSVLLLDEPLSNLDAGLRRHMRTEIRSIQKRLGTTSVLVTHDRSEALAMSDYILVMRAGRGVQFGAPTVLYARPNSRYVAECLGPLATLTGRIEHHDDAGTSLFRLSDGQALVSSEVRADNSTDAVAIIRPQHIHLSDEVPPDTTVRPLKATVVESIFTGERWETTLRVGQSSVITAYGDSEPRTGATVYATVLPENVVILPASDDWPPTGATWERREPDALPDGDRLLEVTH